MTEGTQHTCLIHYVFFFKGASGETGGGSELEWGIITLNQHKECYNFQ